MIENVAKIEQRKPTELALDLDTEIVINMASTHLNALTHILVEPDKEAVELNNADVAALLWPLTEIMRAADKRGA